MRKSIRWILAVLLSQFAVGLTALHAASLTTGADFLLMTAGARPDGMGDAFSAVADDVNTLTFNPAGLGNIRLPEIGFGWEEFFSGIHYDFIGAAIPTGDWGVLGLGYLGLGVSPFNSTASSSTPTVSAGDSALVLGWGKSFYDIHVGAAVKYISRQVDDVQGNGFAFDLGLRYRPIPDVTLAASALNIGPGIKMVTVEPLPTLLTLGAAWTLLDVPYHNLTLASDVATNLTEQTKRFSFGAEYWYDNTVALRAGYLTDSQDQGFSAGAGVKFSFAQIDYSYQPFNVLGSVHRISGTFRWDGPWVPGVEPNQPRYVSARHVPGALEITWDSPEGPVQSYEVVVEPLDGSALFISPPVFKPPYYFKGIQPETLYKVSVRSVGQGGIRSFPSLETYCMVQNEEVSAEDFTGKTSVATGGVFAKVDSVGLQMSWPKGPAEVSGYNLYRLLSSGRAEKFNRRPKHANQIWIVDPSGLEGCKWVVTEILPQGEKAIGSYQWYSTAADQDLLVQRPQLNLHATPQKNHKVYLDWNNDGTAASYELVYSPDSDGIYEAYSSFKADEKTSLMTVSSDDSRIYFILASKDAQGALTARSNSTESDLYYEDFDNN
jgi:hypothetical protein